MPTKAPNATFPPAKKYGKGHSLFPDPCPLEKKPSFQTPSPFGLLPLDRSSHFLEHGYVYAVGYSTILQRKKLSKLARLYVSAAVASRLVSSPVISPSPTRSPSPPFSSPSSLKRRQVSSSALSLPVTDTFLSYNK